MRKNIAGIDAALLARHLPDLAGFDIARFLAQLKPAETIAARHTVGLVDVIGGHPAQVNDGLPESLEEVVATYGHTYFKLKVGGDVDADLARLIEIAAVLDTIAEPYYVSLDGNEQYNDIGALLELWRRMQSSPATQAADRQHSVHRAADHPRARTRQRRLDAVAGQAGDHR